jgi:hypothetical protein
MAAGAHSPCANCHEDFVWAESRACWQQHRVSMEMCGLYRLTSRARDRAISTHDGAAPTADPTRSSLVVGIAGGEYAIRGFLDAYDAQTGQRAWRFWTIPAPGEPGSETWPAETWERGGAPTWVTGSYDPELN